MEKRVILSPKTSDCLAINEKVLNIIPEALKTYLSTDLVSCNKEEEVQNYPFEFISSLTPSGMPLHRLNLKVGAIVMLLRNLLISQGLCNGTRMKVQILHKHCVEASLVTGSNRGHTVLIPRIKLSPSDANIPFRQNRLQFPYSMTINKAQGQTFEKVGIHLPQPVFSHSQLYVALSRVQAMNNIKVRVMTLNWDNRQGQKRGVTCTQNIVYHKVL
ncbi:ATP-dependent DNA helicase PIF1-like [Octopus sinensis]|uniref:ATP-dependent DNA helicase PIF1-like n=1 Tax=Octopus sinensis TaxID=2607531 RepID=A0A6P7S6N2_9MOLL|nr:ATP-dependent DNA helicase PIF1-like [Octopus sinensis]